MFRVPMLVVPFCLVIAGCATPPDGASGALPLVAPRALASPADTGPGDPGAWTTESFGYDPVAAAPREEDPLEDLDERHLTLLLGERQLDDDEWDPVEDQLAGGVIFDASDTDTGNGFEVGMSYSQDDDEVGPVDVDGNVFDVFAGYRYTFDLDEDDVDDPDDFSDDVHPYLAAGGAIVRGEVEVDTPGGDDSDDDISPGAYIRAGIGFDVGEDVRLGVDYRHLFLSDMDIGSIDDADFDQFMVTLGFDF
jgi:opacity protein-like surface antigen